MGVNSFKVMATFYEVDAASITTNPLQVNLIAQNWRKDEVFNCRLN